MVLRHCVWCGRRYNLGMLLEVLRIFTDLNNDSWLRRRRRLDFMLFAWQHGNQINDNYYYLLWKSYSATIKCKCNIHHTKKVKVAHTRLPSLGFRSWSKFLAVSLQVTWVIKPAVGCHYFPPGLQLPLQPLRGLTPTSLLGEQRHDGCEQFA